MDKERKQKYKDLMNRTNYQNYILVADSNNKVIIFEENKKNLLYKFLKNHPVEISEENYFKEEEFSRFDLYRHIANSDKTDKEFEEYEAMAKRVGLPAPNRNSTIRRLHERFRKINVGEMNDNI